MGRPLKQGLDYFPLDVDFYQDIKVRKITKAHGIKSTPVLICLLSNIYRGDGYYLRWDGDMPFLIAEESGAEEGVVTEVLSKAQKVDFFDAGIFETYRVLTSRGIQKRYFSAVKDTKRKKIVVIENFLLIPPEDVPKSAVWCHATTMSKNGNFELKTVNSGGNTINSGGNSINSCNNQQRKEKESREKERERKAEERKTNDEKSSAAAIPASVLDAYQRGIRPICNEMEQEKLADDVAKYGEDTVIKAIERAVVRGKRSIGYIEGILQRWEVNGYDDQAPPRRQDSQPENPQLAIARRAIEMLRGEKARNE